MEKFRILTAAFALSLAALAVLLLTQLIISSLPAMETFGFRFVIESAWDPVKEVFGALPFIYGTLVTSFIALLFAVPLSIGAAVFLTQYISPKVSYVLSFLIEIIAAIPSVVIGLWGIFVVIPFVREEAGPFLVEYLGFIPTFQGPVYGPSILTGALILTIMIVPIITSITKDAINTVPILQREGMIALGATRWEVITKVMLPYARPGIMGGVMLGLGRAIGETMAITMVIGNAPEIPASLLAPGDTLASVIANQFSEATSALHESALIELGLILFIITIVINICARLILRREVARE
ncbi:MAG: phosphate ABC transporter permease subunit PstC [Candidatus Thermoplasmatota archaeon]|nr:phosphate ABC transporter permease subunit PstC [Candidatus Thermoplasmatota archaeon]